ncbi:hypothetical protein [Aureimonas psammosilenae]|uniref:hypothetical protein n=1 Tax=Aureimonas psammosilenae TaxID=2495496 RepID=UPI0012608248|nr:hypothetical protein [Aureimonas psammosilenae]
MSLLAIITDHASPELSPGVSTRWRGQVDRFDPLAGIEGWALALDRPEMRLELELTVGEDAFALSETGRPRGDVANRLSESCLPGFRFDAGVFARLARLGSHRSGLPVGVRIAGTETRLLPSAGVNPTVGELVEAWRASVLAALASSEPRVTKGDRLLGRLSAFRAEAELTARTPLRPFSDNEIGQIDAVHLAAEGQVWFLGSMKRGTEPEFPAVVADRQKYAAGIAVLHYERQDLPSGSVGVVGVMDTGWTPPALSKDGFLYVGRQGQYHLRFGTHTRLLRTDAFLAAYGQVQAIAGGLSAEAIGQVLGAGSTWLVGNAAAAGIVAEGGIDRLLMLPGFGCLAEGWAVSPAKRVETFHMKIGDCVLTAEAESTSFRPRPDLQSVFGGSVAVTQRAGFTAALRGALPAEASGVPLLRIVHDDGSMSVQRVEAKALRRLDPVADGEEVLRLFPALRFEPFYPAFLKAIDRQIAERTREPAALGEAMPAEKLLVVRLPAEQANLRLVFDHLARRLGELAIGTGVALLCDGGAGRGEARLLYRELKAASAAPLSLFALPHEEDGIAELPFLLSHLRAERFLYVGRGLALTAEGWGSVDASLSRRGHFVDRFEIVDDNGLPDRVDGALGVACFGWSTAALLGWSRTAPRSLRGAFRSGGLPQAPGRDRVVPGAAIRLERPKASRLADMVDEDLCAFAQSGEEAV